MQRQVPVSPLYVILRGGTAVVWLLNGMFAKLLHGVPRHEAIVARILGPSHAGPITRCIGVLEVGMGLWILSGIKPRWCVWTQLIAIGIMNALEAVLAPDLLLWGPWNAVWAAVLMAFIWATERLRVASLRVQP